MRTMVIGARDASIASTALTLLFTGASVPWMKKNRKAASESTTCIKWRLFDPEAPKRFVADDMAK